MNNRQTKVTAEKVAINAVMAGCEPAHMPLLMAAAEALADERCKLASIGSSSGIFPYVLVNGRIPLTGSGRELLSNPEVRAAYLEGGHA